MKSDTIASDGRRRRVEREISGRSTSTSPRDELQSQAVVFVVPNEVMFTHWTVEKSRLGSEEVLLQTEASVVSPGTELAVLGGGEAWAPLPQVPGYGSVGRVLVVGSNVRGIRVGDRVFTHGRHAAQSYSANIIVPVPAGLSSLDAVFARIGQIAMTALRISEARLGDFVAVLGLGSIGNMAAQLFALSGCEVIGIDPSAGRAARAGACGVHHTLSPEDNLVERVRQITGGRMCRTVVDATGAAAVIETAPALAGSLGEVILLGSPRGAHRSDLTGFLNQVHLWKNGCITIKGAHEWRLPVREDPTGRVLVSMEGNVKSLLQLLAEGRLNIEPLKSHVVSPTKAAEIYAGLTSDKEHHLGVVFDWSRV